MTLKPATLLAIGGAGAILRWSATALNPPVALLVPLQLLHACSFAATHLGLMGFMTRSVPRSWPAGRRAMSRRSQASSTPSATLASGFVFAAIGGHAYLS